MRYTITMSGKGPDAYLVQVDAHETLAAMYLFICEVNEPELEKVSDYGDVRYLQKYWSFCQAYDVGNEVEMCRPSVEEVEQETEYAQKQPVK